MAALHAAWWDSALHVWSRNQNAEALRALLAEWSSDVLLPSAGKESSLVLKPLGSVSLHSRPSGMGSGPAASSDTAVMDAAPPSRGAAAPVTLVTLAFAPADAVDLLVRLPSPAPASCGASLAYWAVLSEYALSLLQRRQFVPDVIETKPGVLTAQWRPVVTDTDELAWLEAHAAAMPVTCRVAAAEDARAAEPLRLIEDFLNTCIDAVVRQNLASDPFFGQIHERARHENLGEVHWLSALLGPDRVVHGPPEDVALLADRVRTWVGGLEQPSTQDDVRLCFTLLEPEETASTPESSSGDTPDLRNAETWRIELQLESASDCSRRFSIAQVWHEPAGPPGIFARHRGNRRDQLLAEFSRAEKLFPALESLLGKGDPSSLDLTAWEARAFMREWGPLLAGRGFKVTLPEWAGRADRRLGLRLFVRPRDSTAGTPGPSSGMLGLESLVAFDWRVAVGDTEIEQMEFERLVHQGAPLVRHGDAWLEIDPDSAGQALEFLRRQSSGDITLGEALRIAYGAQDLDTALPVVGLSGASWIDTLLRGVPDKQVRSLPQPAGFRGSLRPYQRRGLDWLAFMDACGLGACLADDMGLGKTIQLIALLLHEREVAVVHARQGDTATRRQRDDHAEPISSPGLPVSWSTCLSSPTLLFAPASVVGNWERELQRFAPSLRVLVHHGPQRLEGEAFQRAALCHDVVITTYALGHRDFDELRRVPWGRVVLDEAQKIKNPHASQTAAIRSIGCARRVALTGTPIENHLSELWSIMEALNPGLLGTAAQFRERFVTAIEKQADRQRAAQLRKMLQPFILRRAKSDPGVICDLPEKMEMRVFCNLTVEQAAQYRQIMDESLTAIDGAGGIRRRGLILAMLTRLKQVCDHPLLITRDGGPLDDRSGKCERLVEMLEEVLEEGDAALVFTQYRQMGHLLEKLIAERLKCEAMFLHGGTPTKRRDQMIERFQDPAGGQRIFLLSLRAGGLGINLTRANHVFHFDRWWNPAVEAQATDRSHRVGQTRRVQVHKFVCIGTVEERIDRMLEEKKSLAEHVIKSGDEWLTGLSTTELREYVTLSQEAVG